MRALFSDGYNSFWHIVFGILACQYGWLISLLFIAYQLNNQTFLIDNTLIDCAEFGIGFAATKLVRFYDSKTY